MFITQPGGPYPDPKYSRKKLKKIKYCFHLYTPRSLGYRDDKGF